MALIFDIETNGFLENVTKIHCLVIRDTEHDSSDTYTEGMIKHGLERLMESKDVLVGHNIIKYDIPVIQKLYPWFKINEELVEDTLVLSRLIFSNLKELDAVLVDRNIPAVYQNGKLIKEAVVVFPTKLWGSHSLKAWGYRLGLLKGTYGEQEDAWDEFTPEMLEYCVQDVEVTRVLYNKLQSYNYPWMSNEIEHKTAHICARMERSGWKFDKKAAAELYVTLVAVKDEILKEMMDTFEPIVEERWSEKTGKRLKDKVTIFNPGSRPQIADRLIKKYGWKPNEYTPAGQVKIDEDILKGLDYPEAKTLAKYFLVDKRISQLAEGDQAWLKLERDGYIHGSINTNGAVTGRATHQAPNMAQVPAVRSPYGKQCRGLFTVPRGFSMVGADLSGLELRCLAHFMHRWDGGTYGETVINGKQDDGTDIHSVNQRAAGLPTRDDAKTFIYGFLYGAGDAKIGTIVGGSSKDGKRLKEQFLASTPALANLRKAVSTASKRGYLIGLDGRKLHVRSEHSALNVLLQSAGALISKQWLIEVDLWATKRGLKYGYDGDWTMLGWIHDEIQFAVKEDLAEEFGQAVVDCARKAGEFFKFNLPIGAEFKVGMNWAETH